MGAGLRSLWGLKDAQRVSSTEQSERFRADFTKAIEGVNVALRAVVSQATPASLQKLNVQRDALYAAYQKALAQIDSKGLKKADDSIRRVLAATVEVQKHAVSLAQSTLMSSEEWRAREDEFAELGDRIRELEEAEHPKAGVLRNVADKISDLANKRDYRDALTGIDQLAPIQDDMSNYAKACKRMREALVNATNAAQQLQQLLLRFQSEMVKAEHYATKLAGL